MRERVGLFLLIFGIAQLALGLSMAFVPGTFFEEIGPYGPRNDHYLRDTSTFYLALGAVSLVAWRAVSWRIPVLVFALLQYVLHSLNHVIDVGDADPEWLGPANLISLALTAALLAWIVQAARART